MRAKTRHCARRCGSEGEGSSAACRRETPSRQEPRIPRPPPVPLWAESQRALSLGLEVRHRCHQMCSCLHLSKLMSTACLWKCFFSWHVLVESRNMQTLTLLMAFSCVNATAASCREMLGASTGRRHLVPYLVGKHASHSLFIKCPWPV